MRAWFNNAYCLVQAARIAAGTLFENFGKPFMCQCSTCKRLLYVRDGAKEISHGTCWRCAYKAMGGTVPRVPQPMDFQIYRDLFQKHPEPHDERWISRTIYKGLVNNGRIIQTGIKTQTSLTADERNILILVRDQAREHGCNERYIIMTENEGMLQVLGHA